MENLQVFRNSEFGELGVLIIDGREYFPATACAKFLGYSNPRDAVKRHCKQEGCVKRDAWVQTGIKADGSPAMRENSTNYINEGNLYRLITHSKLPAAERFERWVFDECLPAIRKQGAYIPAAQIPEIVTQAVRATVVEMTRQLIPAIAEAVRAASPNPAAGSAAPIVEPAGEDVTTTIHIVERKRKRRNVPGKIERLPQDLRDEVVDMLKNDATYAAVSDYLAGQGCSVSVMAVSRFYNKAQETLDASDVGLSYSGTKAAMDKVDRANQASDGVQRVTYKGIYHEGKRICPLEIMQHHGRLVSIVGKSVYCDGEEIYKIP